MSEIIELRNTPKGQLQYSPHSNTSNTVKLKHQLDQLSPPPLSRFHEEKESSKLNLSFGLDPESYGSPQSRDADFNQNCALRSENSACHNGTVDLTFKKESPFSSRREKSDSMHDSTFDHFETPPGFGGWDVGKVTSVKTPPGFAGWDVGKVTSVKTSPGFGGWDVDKVTSVKTPPGFGGWDVDKVTSVKTPVSCMISPEYGYTSCAIVDTEREWNLSSQLSVFKRQAEFDHHNRSLSYLMDNKENETLARLSQQAIYRERMVNRKLQQGLEEGHKRRQQLKDDHQEHLKRINIKQMEIERQREQLKEEERKRKEHIIKLHGLWKDIDSNRQAYIQRHDGFSFKSHLPEIVDKYRAVLEKICVGLAALLAENVSNLDELTARFEEDRTRSCQVLSFLDNQIELTEQRVKAEEEKQKELEKKKVEELADAKKQQATLAQDLTVQSLAYVLKEYEDKSKILSQVEAMIRPFVENAQNKTFRFSIQRAVNTPINAVSDFSGPHLLEKMKKLKDLLHGQIASLAGNTTPGNVPPEALLFCQNLIAKMLVKKGEEQVTSKHESAFPIGIVVVGLWQEFPIIGELFMAHLQALCPYVLPIYPPRQENQSSIDYHKSLGYKVSDDGTVEEQDKFLRRMSGLMRLYCSCMVAHLPPGVNSPHPHGLENAWKWLARTMNLEPHPDVTAAMIFDILSVTGHALFREYRIQFAKLLHLMYRGYFPKLESVSVTSGTVGRLKILAETSVKNANIPPPEGILSANFFFKPADPVQ